MRLTIEKIESPDDEKLVIYLQLFEVENACKTEEIQNNLLVDYVDDKICGIEILGPIKLSYIRKLNIDKKVVSFLENCLPKELILD